MRVRESTGQTSKTKAREVHDKRKQDLKDSISGIRKKKQRALLFSVAAERYEEKRTTRPRKPWAPKTLAMAQNAKTHLGPVFGKQLVSDIGPEDIRRYQRQRIEEGAAPRSINLEVSFLRGVMGKSLWARLRDDEDDDKVEFLEEPESGGLQLPPEDEARLLTECNRSRSRALYPFVTLAIETGARKNVIRTLQWKWVDFANRCIQFGKDKTPAGTGRVIPLNQRAFEVLKMWALEFPHRQPEHYVFPAERYGASVDGVQCAAYDTDPTKPIASIKEAWEHAKKRAGVECRFHDLKHTAVTRMVNARVPIPTVAKIVGWSDSTMVRMAKRYHQPTVDDLRPAMEKATAISAGDPPRTPPLVRGGNGGRTP